MQPQEYEHLSGLVLASGEHNYHDHSDWYAVVWCPLTAQPVELTTGSTRYGGPRYLLTPDATTEIRAAYEGCKGLHELLYQLSTLGECLLRPYDCIGFQARVRAGKRRGKIGIVRWCGVNQYRTYYRNGYNRPDSPGNTRVKLQTASGEEFFTDASNLQPYPG